MASQASRTPQPTSSHVPPSCLGNHEHLHVRGYPKLAFFFSRCPRYLHLRSFSALAVRLLLYRQHELSILEETLLRLEARDEKRLFSSDFGHLKSAQDGQEDEQRRLYEVLKKELKEYEEALLRFDQLGMKGYDVTKLRTVQSFLLQHAGDHPLSGCDAPVWGSLYNPHGHATDIIQVVKQTDLSTLGRIFRDKSLSWAPRMPEWLFMLLFWSRRRADMFHHYQHSSRTFEIVSLSIGHFVTSFFVYGAVALLYFTSNKAASVAAVIIIAGTITVCSILFRNQQFISMLATVCAVLVTLLLGDGIQRPPPTRASV